MKDRAWTLLILLAIAGAYALGYWQGQGSAFSVPAQPVSVTPHAHTRESDDSVHPSVQTGSNAVMAGRIDPNRANAEDFQKLPGIGPVLAGRIVADRKQNGRFSSGKDLMRVPGIGPVLAEKLTPHLVFQEQP